MLCVATLATASGLLSLGVDSAAPNNDSTAFGSFNQVFTLGFGAVNPTATLDLSFSSVVAMILLANNLQILLSYPYVAYNGVYTCMLLADEWSGYGKQRKPLRVSSP